MHEIVYYESIDSTNEQLKRVADNAQNGLVAWAGEQTLGKGRLGRKWISESNKGAWFSVLIKDGRLNGKNAHGLVFVSALAAATSLRKLSNETDILIKWPNDIVLHGKKIAGILCESVFDGDKPLWCICGIGINLLGNVFPKELPWAASVESEAGIRLEAEDVIKRFLEEFDTVLEEMLAKGLGTVLRMIKPLSATLGQLVSAENANMRIVGTAKDFTEDGALIIINKDGAHTVNVGDVSVRGVMGYT